MDAHDSPEEHARVSAQAAADAAQRTRAPSAVAIAATVATADRQAADRQAAAPAPPGPGGESRGPTADHIAERAAELFARKGFAATSIREIADAAGITKPTLYYYFGSKEGLVRHIHDSVNAVFAAQVEELQSGGLPLAPTLERLAGSLLCYADSHPAVVQLLLRLQHLPAGESLIGDLRSVQERNLSMLSRVFGDAAARGDVVSFPPDFLALSYLGALSAHILHRVSAPPGARPDPTLSARRFTQLFFQGAAPAGADAPPPAPSPARNRDQEPSP